MKSKKAKYNKEQALSILQQMCSKKEYCPRDISTKLRQWGVEGADDELIEILKDDNFISEERYCNAYVNDKVKFSKWGKNKIRYQLSGKGLQDKHIDLALENVDREEYMEIMNKELEKKLHSIKEEDPFKRKEKLSRFAQQRGYEWELVSEVMESLF